MAVNPIGGSALQGIQRGFQGLRRAAADIAGGVKQGGETAATTDFNRALVELQQSEIQTKSSAKALKAYNETLGTLLDIKA
jgi:hypothetical protein